MPYIDDLNTVLADPEQRTAYLYNELGSVLNDLLDCDPRGWEDVLIKVRTVARLRRADVLLDALRDHYDLDKAARQQDTVDSLRDPHDDGVDARFKDTALIQEAYGMEVTRG